MYFFAITVDLGALLVQCAICFSPQMQGLLYILCPVVEWMFYAVLQSRDRTVLNGYLVHPHSLIYGIVCLSVDQSSVQM